MDRLNCAIRAAHDLHLRISKRLCLGIGKRTWLCNAVTTVQTAPNHRPKCITFVGQDESQAPSRDWIAVGSLRVCASVNYVLRFNSASGGRSTKVVDWPTNRSTDRPSKRPSTFIFHSGRSGQSLEIELDFIINTAALSFFLKPCRAM